MAQAFRGEQTIATDVLILGTGAAGLRAAIEAKARGIEVLVISKMGVDDLNSTIRAWGGFTFARPELADELFRQVVETGGYLNDQRLVERFVADTPQRIAELADLGVDLEVLEGADKANRLGVTKVRGQGSTTGYGITRPLRRAAADRGVRFLDRLTVSSLLVSGDRVVGAAGVQAGEDAFWTIAAKSIVLATGGGACLYERTDNPEGTTADGIALAFAAGADLIDLELVSLTYPAKQLDAVFRPGSPPEQIMSRGGAHYFLGGVRIDPTGRTTVPGLLAAGEVAGGLFGAGRLGGSALADTVVFGAAAGMEAARQAADTPPPRLDPDQVAQERRRLTRMVGSTGARTRAVAAEVRRTMWRCAGPLKTDASLDAAATRLAELDAGREEIQVESAGDLRAAIECVGMLDVARLICAASRLREETRGCFWRQDFPRPDNASWIRNILLRRGDGLCQHEVRPAVMTRLTSPGQPRIGAGCFDYLPART